MLLVGGLSAHFVRIMSISNNFSDFYLTRFRHVGMLFVMKNAEVQTNNLFDENQSCPPFNSVQDAPSIKLRGPYFDDFVDISIFMIWGWDPTFVLVGSVPSGRYFSPKSPF